MAAAPKPSSRAPTWIHPWILGGADATALAHLDQDQAAVNQILDVEVAARQVPQSVKC